MSVLAELGPSADNGRSGRATKKARGNKAGKTVASSLDKFDGEGMLARVTRCHSLCVVG